MGYMTTVTILNDAWDQVKKNPDQLIHAIDRGMHGLDSIGRRDKQLCSYGAGNHANCIEVAQSHHADDPRLYFVWANMTTSIGKTNDLIESRHLDVRKIILSQVKKFIKEEENQIKEMEARINGTNT